MSKLKYAGERVEHEQIFQCIMSEFTSCFYAFVRSTVIQLSRTCHFWCKGSVDLFKPAVTMWIKIMFVSWYAFLNLTLATVCKNTKPAAKVCSVGRTFSFIQYKCISDATSTSCFVLFQSVLLRSNYTRPLTLGIIIRSPQI